MSDFQNQLQGLLTKQRELIERKNPIDPEWNNNVFDRYVHPVITDRHIPLFWRYDFSEERNPHLLERLGIGCALNPGAIKFNGKYHMMIRVEGYDRKSFFALASSDNGIDNFRFHDYPIVMPETERRDTNVYDMRMVAHEDGYIYGLFCTERKDENNPDLSAAEAQCGIARSKDLINWERLPDLKTPSPQQRNVVLHPEFVNGEYAFYTRPQDGFISAGSGGGIGWGTCKDINNPVIDNESIIDSRIYHTIKEVKNGAGAPPIKTDRGWLHIAHGVRGCAAGLRYVLYAFVCDLNDPSKVIASPGGHFIAPHGIERIGDVSNVVFCNGAIDDDDGTVFIYYASSDTRCHVATSSIDKLLDYCFNTPSDPLFSADCVQQRSELISRNLEIIGDDQSLRF